MIGVSEYNDYFIHSVWYMKLKRTSYALRYCRVYADSFQSKSRIKVYQLERIIDVLSCNLRDKQIHIRNTKCCL